MGMWAFLASEVLFFAVLIANYLVLRERLLERHGIDLAMWINLGSSNKPIADLEGLMEKIVTSLPCPF